MVCYIVWYIIHSIFKQVLAQYKWPEELQSDFIYSEYIFILIRSDTYGSKRKEIPCFHSYLMHYSSPFIRCILYRCNQCKVFSCVLSCRRKNIFAVWLGWIWSRGRSSNQYTMLMNIWPHWCKLNLYLIELISIDSFDSGAVGVLVKN